MQDWINLSERSNDGIRVSLNWNPETEEIAVTVATPSEGFILYPPNDRALQCFYHPYAYAHSALMSGRMDRVI